MAPGFQASKHLRSFDADVSESGDTRHALSGSGLILAVAAATLSAAAIAAAYFLLPLLDVESETVLKVVLILVGAFASFVLVALGRAVVPIRGVQTRKRFEYPDQFARSFYDLLGETKAERVVVGIDNLDRCSPDRVAEILTAVKTFLEPAPVEPGKNASRPRLTFLIAADDAALRRHLESKESTEMSVRVRAASPNEQSLADDIRHSVTEYLRKFFNAHIRISEILDEDMEVFAERELAPFFTFLPEIPPDTRARLVELTAYGLKRNPRRVKQFVNNLALRLRLFERRYEQGRTQSEPDILVLAKLVLLEEEHPDEYAALVKEPTLLATWHEQAAGGDAQKHGLRPEFARYLQFTAQIKVRDLPAYLRTKQTKAEQDLPAYTEFSGFLDDGNTDSIAEMLQSVSQVDRAKFVDAAERYFDTQWRESSWRRAQNALRCIVEVGSLHGDNRVALKNALRKSLDSALKERLGELDAATLLTGAKSTLPRAEFDQVVDAMLVGIQGEEPKAEPSRVLSGFVQAKDVVDGPVVDRLRAALDDQYLAGQPAAYVSVAETWPAALGRPATDTTLAALQEDRQFAPDSPEVRVALSACASPEVADQADNLLRAIRSVHGRAIGEADADAYMAFAEALRPALERASSSVRGEYVNDITARLDEGTPQSRQAAFGFGLDLCLGDQAVDDGEGEELGRRFVVVEQRSGVQKVLGRIYMDLSDRIRAGVLTGLGETGTASESENLASTVAELAQSLPGSSLAEIAEAVATRAIDANSVDAVAALLDALEDEESQGIWRKVVEAIEEEPARVWVWLPVVRSATERHFVWDQASIRAIGTGIAVAVRKKKDEFEAVSLLEDFEITDEQIREEVVRELLASEPVFSAVPRRSFVLGVADRLAREADGAARTLVDQRLSELEAGSNKDKQVARNVKSGRSKPGEN